MFIRKFEKRKYQVDVARAALRHRAKRVLIVSPGGSGKTVIAALIVQLLVESKKGKRVLLLSHRREIVEQTARALKGKVPIGLIMAGHEPNPEALIQITSIATLGRRELPDADLVIVDEAHRSAAATYGNVLKKYEKRGAKIIGMSATPYRLDGRGLQGRFDVMLEAAKPSQLLGKYIMMPRIFSAGPEHLPNLLGVRTDNHAREYKLKDLVRRVNKMGLISGVVKEVSKRIGDRTGVVFCVSVKHSKKVAAALRAAGYTAQHIDGTLSPTERGNILEQLRDGRLQLVTCCLVLAEGWDLPSCDYVALTRPTRSLSMFIQMTARASRMSSRRPIIVDHALCTFMHNYPYIDREWSLEGNCVGSNDRHQTKACAACGRINAMQATCCTECSKPFPTRELSVKEQTQLELTELNSKNRSKKLRRIVAYAKKHNMSKRWVARAIELWDSMLDRPDDQIVAKAS